MIDRPEGASGYPFSAGWMVRNGNERSGPVETVKEQ